MRLRVDAFIIGGGLAGVHLALAMIRKGLDPLIIDEGDPNSSSRVAAGMINPITGRRFALSWIYEELQKVFTEEYLYWEGAWERSFFEKIKIYRSIPDNVLVNDLDARLHDPLYSRYCREMTREDTEKLNSSIRFDGPGYIFDGYRLDSASFLDHGIEFMKARHRYVSEKLEVKIDLLGNRDFCHRDFVSDKVIFCTGNGMLKNPLFEWGKMEPNKGEVLLLRVEDWKFRDIVKHKLFYVPLSGNLLWVGTYNTRDYEDEKPSDPGYNHIEELVRENLLVPYEVKAHLSALRPTVKDNRPIIGAHPENSAIHIFNGFGSKGSSLIPYFARQLVSALWEEGEVMKEVRADRFWN